MKEWINVKDGLPKHMEKVLAIVNGEMLVAHVVYGLSFEDREKMKNGEIPSEMCGGWCGDPMVYSESPRWKIERYGDQTKHGNREKAYRWSSGSDATHWTPLPAHP